MDTQKKTGPQSNPVTPNQSTAVDLNAGHGTDRGPGASEPKPNVPGTRGSTAARQQRGDESKASPDGPQGADASSTAYETEGLSERRSGTDVEGGVSG